VKSILINDYEFLEAKDGNIHIVFSTAKGELDFNINKGEGIVNINKLKNWFNLDEIGYLHQIHSNIIYMYDGKIKDGDAIITDRRNIAVGVFTADCVPVMIYDKEKNIIAAVHSGWKGTLDSICSNTVLKMKNDYDCNVENLVVYIGPHNGSCCYQIGKDVEKLFFSKDIYTDLHIVESGNLNLEKCIIAQLQYSGVPLENIKSSGICTFCSKDFQLYSYRKQKEKCGRLFSFIYFK
jgi:polyphenol oxidase